MADDHAAEHSDRGPGPWLLKAGAYAGAITAIIALIVWVVTKLSPGPPPAVLRASVTKIVTEPGRTEYVYFASHRAALLREEAALHREHLSKSEIRQVFEQRGVTVEFTVDTDGPAGHAWLITESLYNNATGAREANIEGNYWNAYRYVPAADSHTRSFPSWIQYPGPGEYFVEIEVNDGTNSPITEKSAVFRVPKS